MNYIPFNTDVFYTICFKVFNIFILIYTCLIKLFKPPLIFGGTCTFQVCKHSTFDLSIIWSVWSVTHSVSLDDMN